MKYRISKEQFKSAISAHLKKRAMVVYPIVALLIGIVAVVRYSNDAITVFPMYIVACLLLMAWGVVVHKILVWQQSKQYEENPEFAEETSASLIDNELVISSEKSTTSVPRARIIKFIKTDGMLMLYRTRFMFHLIPRVDDKDYYDIENWITKGRG